MFIQSWYVLMCMYRMLCSYQRDDTHSPFSEKVTSDRNDNKSYFALPPLTAFAGGCPHSLSIMDSDTYWGGI